ncbi:MAG: condensation domain-containing protein [Xanthobacteraceae bacterium]
MTAAQARFWRHEQLSESAGANNSLATMRLTGRLEVGRFASALRSLITRHEILRTRFEQSGDTAVQIVEPSGELRMALVDLRGLPDYREMLDKLRGELLRRPFDMGRPPLLDLVLVRLERDVHVLLFVVHHIISDGWSQSLLIRELVAAYQSDRPPEPAALVPQYSQYAAEERQRLSSEEFSREHAWWSRYLAGAVQTELSNELTGLPGARGLKHHFNVDAATISGLIALGSRNRASLTTVLLAGLLLTLRERTGQQDGLIGLLSGLRSSATMERILGCMTNILCLRTQIAPCGIDELIRGVRDGYLDVLEHAQFPIEHAAALLPPRIGTPIEIVYVAQPPRVPDLQLDGLTMEVIEFGEHIPVFPLVVMSTPAANGVAFSLEYDAALYRESEIAALAEHLHWTLRQLAGPATGDTTAIGRSFVHAQKQSVAAAGATPAASTKPIDWSRWTVHGLFESRAAISGNAVAIVGPSGSITYRQLDQWAARIAAALQRVAAAEPESVVALACTRSMAMIAGWLGIMKAGAIALPIDLGESGPEIERRIRWAKAVLVLTDVPLERLAAAVGGSTPALDVVAYRDRGESGPVPRRVPAEHAAAYICFTSGSTGAPAAVVGTHAATVNRLLWLQQEYAIRPHERCAVRTSPAFVDAVAEIFGPLCAGASLILCDEAIAFEPVGLVDAIRGQRIERVTLVPTLLRSMMPELERNAGALPGRIVWHVSGEPLSLDLLQTFRAIRPQDTLLNLYGSAEVAADISCGRLSEDDAESVHVGRPIANCKLMVLDRQLHPTPPFVEGDVYAEGIALCHGYLQDPARTADRFVPSPEGIGVRMYRTGDRGYWLSDGNLRLVGRQDRQIKRRGVRISLDGVERSLESLHAIAAAAVYWNAEAQRMVALVTQRAPASVAWIAIDEPQPGMCKVAALPETVEQELWAAVVSGLPAAALPDRMFVLDRLPRTSGGKINYGLLERVSWHAVRTRLDQHDGSAASPTEQALIEICERVLRREGVNPSERFLELGMSSLQLVQVVHAVAEAFSIRLKLSQLYAAVSLRQCAELIDAEVEAVASLLEELV